MNGIYPIIWEFERIVYMFQLIMSAESIVRARIKRRTEERLRPVPRCRNFKTNRGAAMWWK
jgi:hypothetical protein